LTEMEDVHHPSARILKYYRYQGVPAKNSCTAWTDKEVDSAMKRGAHKSTAQHAEFLVGEFYNMIKLNQWVLLTYSVAKNIKNLAISPPGVVPHQNC